MITGYLLVRIVSKKRYSVYEISPARDQMGNAGKQVLDGLEVITYGNFT